MTVGSAAPLTAAGKRLDARVVEMQQLSELATWRAARAVGNHDLSSFRLRLDPQIQDAALQPGMTVWLAQR